MLAEIAAANAAFSVIKQALSNGKEIFEVGEEATRYFDNKSVVAKTQSDELFADPLDCEYLLSC